MVTRTRFLARLPLALAALLAVSLMGGATLLGAQEVTYDPRWQAWLGCWKPSDPQSLAPRVVDAGGSTTRLPTVCVIPAVGKSAVEIVTVADGKIVQRTHVEASGERRAISQDGCTGWERAEWARSEFGVYLQSEISCNGAKRASSGLFAMSASGEWLDVQGLDAAGTSGVRVLRYHETSDTGTIPPEITNALDGRVMGVGAARARASSALNSSDVAEASSKVASGVVEAWLVERHQGYTLTLDASAIRKIADAGVPSGVIDVLVAISYPEMFEINPATGKTEIRAGEDTRGAAAGRNAALSGSPVYVDYSPFGWDYYSSARCSLYGYSVFGCSPFGYSPYGFSPYGYSPFGYAPGYGWYPGYQPIVVVRGGGTPDSHGRVVKGRGYTSGGGSSAGTARPRTKSGSNTGASVKMPAESRSPATSEGGSKSSGRTAKPRP